MNSTRLSYEELIYLCVSLTHAKEVYGLAPKSAETPVEWGNVRKDLIEKGILTENQDALQITPLLAYMINAIGSPKLFISIGKSTDSQAHCFYLARHFATGLVKDQNADNHYLLSSYNTPEDVYKAFSDIIEWDNSVFSRCEDCAKFTLEEYETYLKTLRQQGPDEHNAILAEQGFSATAAQNVFDTLSQKKYWFTIVMMSFDPQYTGGRHIVEQSVVFKGDKHLWTMEIDQGGVRLFCSSREVITHKLEIISSLFKYF